MIKEVLFMLNQRGYQPYIFENGYNLHQKSKAFLLCIGKDFISIDVSLETVLKHDISLIYSFFKEETLVYHHEIYAGTITESQKITSLAEAIEYLESFEAIAKQKDQTEYFLKMFANAIDPFEEESNSRLRVINSSQAAN